MREMDRRKPSKHFKRYLIIVRRDESKVYEEQGRKEWPRGRDKRKTLNSKHSS